MKVNKTIIALLSALAVAACAGGCTLPESDNADIITIGSTELPEAAEDIRQEPETTAEPEPPVILTPVTVVNTEIPQPEEKTVSYVTVTGDGVNIRAGAGTGHASLGKAQKSTLYANLGETGGWYKTQYKNKTAYVSKSYCKTVELPASGDERIEAVIAEGVKLLGTPYVYGAVRVHDGRGNLNKNFTVAEFDCSSLMQYMFYKGAGKLIDVNTRTQIYQGTTVAKSQLERGDLMFFTNSSRKNNKGIERVGHVAMYLGGNYILHTASDFAKIEQISSVRWGYFIQAQRMI